MTYKGVDLVEPWNMSPSHLEQLNKWQLVLAQLSETSGRCFWMYMAHGPVCSNQGRVAGMIVFPTPVLAFPVFANSNSLNLFCLLGILACSRIASASC